MCFTANKVLVQTWGHTQLVNGLCDLMDLKFTSMLITAPILPRYCDILPWCNLQPQWFAAALGRKLSLYDFISDASPWSLTSCDDLRSRNAFFVWPNDYLSLGVSNVAIFGGKPLDIEHLCSLKVAQIHGRPLATYNYFLHHGKKRLISKLLSPPNGNSI